MVTSRRTHNVFPFHNLIVVLQEINVLCAVICIVAVQEKCTNFLQSFRGVIFLWEVQFDYYSEEYEEAPIYEECLFIAEERVEC